MPRLVLMTWKANSHRWTKMYKGVRYYVSTRELGLNQARFQAPGEQKY